MEFGGNGGQTLAEGHGYGGLGGEGARRG